MSEPLVDLYPRREAEPAEAAEHLRRANTRLALLNEIVTGLGVSVGRERTTRAVIERLAGALDGVRVAFSTVGADGAIESRLSAASADDGAGEAGTVGATLAPAAEYQRERAFSIQARTASRLTTLVESMQVGVLKRTSTGTSRWSTRRSATCSGCRRRRS